MLKTILIFLETAIKNRIMVTKRVGHCALSYSDLIPIPLFKDC